MIESSFIDDYMLCIVSHLCFFLSIVFIPLPSENKTEGGIWRRGVFGNPWCLLEARKRWGCPSRKKNDFLYLFIMIESSFIDDYLLFIISHLCFFIFCLSFPSPSQAKDKTEGGIYRDEVSSEPPGAYWKQGRRWGCPSPRKNYFLYLFMIETSFIDDCLLFIISHLCFWFSIYRFHLPPKRKTKPRGGGI